jgi:hypothetical protein
MVDEAAPQVEPAVPHVDEAVEPLAGAAAAMSSCRPSFEEGIAASLSEVASSPASTSAGVADWLGLVGAPVVVAALGVAAAAACGGGTVRSLMQYRHLMASSWISSAQYGHFFTTALPVLGPRQLTRLASTGSPVG